MIMVTWLCALPMSLALLTIWQEQITWHHNYLAVHRLFEQARE